MRAAWALGNLVEGASAGLETCGSRVEKWRAATRFAEAAASLLRRLPPGTTLSSSVVAEMDDAEMDDAEIERGEIDACSPMDAEDAEVSSESDGGSASDDEDDEGAARAAARRRRAFVAGSTFRSVHPDARAQIVSALDPGFLKMLVDACLVDARPADAAPDEGGNAFAVPANSAAYAGGPRVSDHRGGGERGWRARGFLLRRRARREAQVRGSRRADVLARVRDAVHRARGGQPSRASAEAGAMAERGER